MKRPHQIVGVSAVFGHSLIQNGRHYGAKYIDEWPKLEQHALAAADLASREPDTALMISGGRTRPDVYEKGVTISEADGIKEYLSQANAIDDDLMVITEPWARDTFENCLFCMLAFYQATGRYPSRFTAVSWRFKTNRILLIGMALRIPHFQVVGVANPAANNLLHAICCETDYLTKMVDTQTKQLVDPCHRSADFEAKRRGRMPPEYRNDSWRYLQDVQQAYSNAAGIDRMFADISQLRPGGDWSRIKWPWDF